MTKILISVTNNNRLEITRRADAARDGDIAVFDEEAFEIPDSIVSAICNSQQAEERAYELLAIWLKKNMPELVDELQIEHYLPLSLR